MVALRWQREFHFLPLLMAALVVVVVAVLAAVMGGGGKDMSGFASAVSLRVAYNAVLVDRTSQRQLANIGLDSGHAGALSLSGLGVQEYFMPRTSRAFDRLAPAVKACFDSEDRCTALVIPLAATEQGGAMAAHAATSGGRIVFLLRSGRVAYKEMVGG